MSGVPWLSDTSLPPAAPTVTIAMLVYGCGWKLSTTKWPSFARVPTPHARMDRSPRMPSLTFVRILVSDSLMNTSPSRAERPSRSPRRTFVTLPMTS